MPCLGGWAGLVQKSEGNLMGIAGQHGIIHKRIIVTVKAPLPKSCLLLVAVLGLGFAFAVAIRLPPTG
jgi:hypothetical protein